MSALGAVVPLSAPCLQAFPVRLPVQDLNRRRITACTGLPAVPCWGITHNFTQRKGRAVPCLYPACPLLGGAFCIPTGILAGILENGCSAKPLFAGAFPAHFGGRYEHQTEMDALTAPSLYPLTLLFASCKQEATLSLEVTE